MATLAFLWAFALLAQQNSRVNQGNKHLPKFEEFPIVEIWQGPPASVKLASSEERMFRTALRKAAKQPPNFAGHYRFTVWGCGMKCEGGAVIDLKSGEVLQPPLARNKAGEEHWIFCTSKYENGGTEYRSDSSLVVVRCGARTDKDGNNTPDTYYFVLEQGRFRELLHMPGVGKFGL
jgi:hypothetical protein